MAQTTSSTEKVLQPFKNLAFQEFGGDQGERFGRDYFRNVLELQVGMANSETDPKIFRANQQGIWLGQKTLVTILNEPVNTSGIKFQVDMNGNVTATSFKTGSSGQRIRIFGDRLESYDGSTPTPRVILDADRLTFYSTSGLKTLETEDNDFRSFDGSENLRALLTDGRLTFYTAAGVKTLEAENDQFRSFDSAGVARVILTSEALLFFNASGVQIGKLYSNGSTALVMTGQDMPSPVDVDLIVNGSVILSGKISAGTVSAIGHVHVGGAPVTPVDGDIWYAGGELKVQKAGTTRNVLTT